MRIMHDDQIDLERVVNDPEYRRHVIVYLNERARPDNRSLSAARSASVHPQPGASGPRMKLQQPATAMLRKIG